MSLCFRGLRWCATIAVVLTMCSGCEGAGEAPPDAWSPDAADVAAEMSKTPEPSPLDPEVLERPAGLSGALYFLEERPFPYHRVHALSLEDGALSTVLEVEEGGFVTDIALRPDGGALALTYIPAPGADDPIDGWYDTVGLFLAPLEGSGDLERLVWPDPGVVLGHPTWAPDGSLYFVSSRDDDLVGLRLHRYDFDERRVEDVESHATSPAISADGQTLVYVQVEPVTGLGGLVLREDERLVRLIEPGDFHLIENVHVGPDGAWVYFTAIQSQEARPKHGGSHSSASDWWRVSTRDSAVEQVAVLGRAVYSTALSGGAPLWLHASTPEGVVSVRFDEKTSGEVEAFEIIDSRAIRDLSLITP